jgi:hypothetical protein
MFHGSSFEKERGMIQRRAILVLVLGLGMAGALGTSTLAQQNGGGAKTDTGDELQNRARIIRGELADVLGVTQSEWQTLEPLLDKVFVLRSRNRWGGGGGVAGATDANPGPAIPIAEASRDLRRTVTNKDATLDEIKAKLQALRDEKAKIRAELAAARAELKAAVKDVRQQSLLVLRQYLE